MAWSVHPLERIRRLRLLSASARRKRSWTPFKSVIRPAVEPPRKAGSAHSAHSPPSPPTSSSRPTHLVPRRACYTRPNSNTPLLSATLPLGLLDRLNHLLRRTLWSRQHALFFAQDKPLVHQNGRGNEKGSRDDDGPDPARVQRVSWLGRRRGGGDENEPATVGAEFRQLARDLRWVKYGGDGELGRRE